MSRIDEILSTDLRELAREKLHPVTVAVIDSGVDATHERNRGRIKKAWKFQAAPEAPADISAIPVKGNTNNDRAGHGTAVASIINTLAPNARIYDIRVLDDRCVCTGELMLEGMKTAIAGGARLINMSLACRRAFKDKIAELCETAYRNHQIVVASKRNIPLSGDLGFPAELSSCISIDSGDFPNPYVFKYTKAPPIEFVAHGESVLVAKTGGGYMHLSGTSFAAPTATAILALLLGKYPDLEFFELKTLLKFFSAQNYARRKIENPLETVSGIPCDPAETPKSNLRKCVSCKTHFAVPGIFTSAYCPSCGRISTTR